MIEVLGLSKRFKVKKSEIDKQESQGKDPRAKGQYFHSVENVSFSCKKGQVLGLLGPNGAGKTTTLRLLSTALTADTGKIIINDIDAVKEPLQARKRIGFLSGNTGLYGRLSAAENVKYFGQLHGINSSILNARCDELFEQLDMTRFINRRAENLSTGMRQKTAIARALIHSPDVVILDEPTTGLDIMAKQTVLTMIKRLKGQNIPVIFSTHQFDEVQQLCDNICIINEGISQYDGSNQEFLNKMDENDFNSAFMNFINSGFSNSSKEGVV